MRVTRRRMLSGAAAAFGLVAAGQVGGASAASAASAAIPATVGRGRVASGLSTVAQTDFPLTHLGVAWAGSGAARAAGSGAAGAPRVRLRTAQGWRDWQVVHGCSAGRDGLVGLDHGGLLLASGATGYEVECSPGSVELSEINVLAGPLRLGLPGGQVTTSLAGYPLSVGYRSRASWGADESLRFAENGAERYPAECFPVQALTVHHTVTQLDDPDPAATVRAIYYDHTITRDFGDIGYHLLIDEAGVIYEGRWSGSDRLPVLGGSILDRTGRPQANNAAHVLSYNAGNVGIALLGDFTDAAPTAAAVGSLIRVLFILCTLCRLNPTGTTNYVNPVSGDSRTVGTISGHRDWRETECPGNKLYAMLPTIRKRARTGGLLP